MKIEKGKYNHKKWNWKLTETINPMLSEKEISNLINKKLAYIIVEMEHSPASYINSNKMKETCCINTETAV